MLNAIAHSTRAVSSLRHALKIVVNTPSSHLRLQNCFQGWFLCGSLSKSQCSRSLVKSSVTMHRPEVSVMIAILVDMLSFLWPRSISVLFGWRHRNGHRPSTCTHSCSLVSTCTHTHAHTHVDIPTSPLRTHTHARTHAHTHTHTWQTRGSSMMQVLRYVLGCVSFSMPLNGLSLAADIDKDDTDTNTATV